MQKSHGPQESESLPCPNRPASSPQAAENLARLLESLLSPGAGNNYGAADRCDPIG